MTNEDREMVDNLFERVTALEAAQHDRAEFWKGFRVYTLFAAIIGLPLLVPPILLGMWRLVTIEVGLGVFVALAWWAVAWSMKRHGWETPDDAPVRVQIVIKIVSSVICVGFFAWLLVPWKDIW